MLLEKEKGHRKKEKKMASFDKQPLSTQAVVEFLGTFLFVSVAIRYTNAILIAVALCAMIVWGSQLSRCAFNPAISTAMYGKGTCKPMNLLHTLLHKSSVESPLFGGFGRLTKTRHKRPKIPQSGPLGPQTGPLAQQTPFQQISCPQWGHL